MFRLSAVDAINPALEHMKAMLFRPFRFKTWLKVGFIGLLAGAASGGGCNFGGRSPGGVGRGGGPSSGQDVEQALRVFLNEHLLLVILLLAFGVALSLAFLYLSCRFRFILFDTVLRRDPQIARGWGLYERPANRYFGFWICFMIASGLALLLIIGVPLWRALKSGVFSESEPSPALFGYILPMILAVLAFVIVVGVIASLFNDFVVPLLALDNLTLGGAWLRLREMVSVEPGAFVIYLLMKLVLSIAAALIVGLAMVVVAIALAIPTVIVVALIVAVLKGSGPVGMAFGILLAVVGVLAGIAVAVLLAMLATAPVAAFFTAYAIYFLGGRYPRLGSLLGPAPPPAPPSPLAAGTPPPSMPGTV
jgi:hypothetical protein